LNKSRNGIPAQQRVHILNFKSYGKLWITSAGKEATLNVCNC